MVDMGILVGTFRRFGLFGPTYEVLGAGTPGASGEARLRVRVLESGEELDYGLERIVADPVED